MDLSPSCRLYPISHIPYTYYFIPTFVYSRHRVHYYCLLQRQHVKYSTPPPVPHVWDTRNAYAPQPIDHSVWFNGLTGAPLYARFLHFNMLYSALALDTAKHVAVWCGENLSVLDARDPF